MCFIFVFLIYLLILFALLFQDSLACLKDIHANKASFYPQNRRATRTDHRLDTANTLPNLLQVDSLWKLQSGSKQRVWPFPLIGIQETYGQWIQLTMKLPPNFLSRDGPNDFGRAENSGWCFLSSWCMVVVLVRTFPSKTMLVSSEIAVDGSEFPAPGQGNDKF